MSRTIKRYANRKLYDTTQSCYVTLDEISELVKDGVDVTIVDNSTHEDLTAVTLAQILLEEEKRKRRTLPLATLRHLVQTVSRPVVNIRQETEKRVEAAKAVISKTEDDARDRVTVFVDSTQKAYDDLQRRVEDSMRAVVNSVAGLGSPEGELTQILTRLEAIEQRLDALQATLSAQSGNS